MSGPIDWRDDALCAQVGGEPFYPEEPGETGAEAKRICASCPVRFPCLEEAVAGNIKDGIWGGMSPRERRKLVRQRRRAEAA